MGLLSAVAGFLFGKDPDIFDKDGRVVHTLPQDVWKAWENRFKSPEYDWRKHSGVTGPGRPAKSSGHEPSGH